MGGAAIKKCRSFTTRRDRISAVFAPHMPLYYLDDEVHTEDIKRANVSWKIIMDGKNTSQFMIARESPIFFHTSILTWFFDTFYEKMFEICPETRSYFSGVSMATQGKLVAGVISSALGMLRDPIRLRKKLTAMTEKHNGKGIKSVYYGYMGTALFYALKHVLGSEFDDHTARSWVKIFSFLLSIIIPVVVNYETNNSRKNQSAATVAPSFASHIKYFALNMKCPLHKSPQTSDYHHVIDTEVNE